MPNTLFQDVHKPSHQTVSWYSVRSYRFRYMLQYFPFGCSSCDCFRMVLVCLGSFLVCFFPYQLMLCMCFLSVAPPFFWGHFLVYGTKVRWNFWWDEWPQRDVENSATRWFEVVHMSFVPPKCSWCFGKWEGPRLFQGSIQVGEILWTIWPNKSGGRFICESNWGGEHLVH